MVDHNPLALLTAFFGVGVFLGGLLAYFEPKIKEEVGLGAMILGIFIMLIGLLWNDLTTH